MLYQDFLIYLKLNVTTYRSRYIDVYQPHTFIEKVQLVAYMIVIDEIEKWKQMRLRRGNKQEECQKQAVYVDIYDKCVL